MLDTSCRRNRVIEPPALICGRTISLTPMSWRSVVRKGLELPSSRVSPVVIGTS